LKASGNSFGKDVGTRLEHFSYHTSHYKEFQKNEGVFQFIDLIVQYWGNWKLLSLVILLEQKTPVASWWKQQLLPKTVNIKLQRSQLLEFPCLRCYIQSTGAIPFDPSFLEAINNQYCLTYIRYLKYLISVNNTWIERCKICFQHHTTVSSKYVTTGMKKHHYW